MSEPLVQVERRSDGVAVVTLSNPKVNALSRALLTELEAAALALQADPPGAVVVTGGDRLFAAGAEISEFAKDGGVLSRDEVLDLGGCFYRALNAVAAIPRATIAAVSGFALGGGCELALACDLRIAATRARFGQPEVLLGIIPGGGGTQRLPRLVGPARAKEIMMSGRQVGAEEALRIGLVDEVVAHDALHDRALELAAQYASGAALTQALIKRAVDAGLDGTLADGLRLEQELFADSFGTEDAPIGVSSFLEHGPGKAEFRSGTRGSEPS
jgi:enoyl-CoA hydratase